MSEENALTVRANVPDESGCSQPIPNCKECLDIAQNSCFRQRFGLRPPFLPENTFNPPCECHDICVQEVRLICPMDISTEIPFPPIGNCRLGPMTPRNIPSPGKCDVFIFCAHERLLPNCMGIEFEVDLLIVCPADSSNPDTMIPVKIRKCCTSFFPFPPTGSCNPSDPFANPVTGTALQRALQEIDGSQLLIQVKAEVLPADAINPVRIKITGKVIDKLWQIVNLWVVGIRPYDFDPGVKESQNIRSITIKEEFTDFGHNIPDCTMTGIIPCTAPSNLSYANLR
jgi:hypothetical protein